MIHTATITEEKIASLLECIRTMTFEEFTAGTDSDWEHATDFAVAVGSRIMEELDLNIAIERD